MHKLGQKQLTLQLHEAIDTIPAELGSHDLKLGNGGSELVYTYDSQGPRTGITHLLTDLSQAGIRFKDLDTSQSSLEDIFVDLVRRDR
jgi:ABC-2 type transport system ATP-binding protein